MPFAVLIDIAYIIAAALIIYGLKKLGSVKTARYGNLIAACGMLLAVLVTLLDRGVVNYTFILAAVIVGTLIGIVTSRLVQLTAMPQLVAVFNGFGGLASVLVATSAYTQAGFGFETFTLSSILFGTLIGAVTFTGSVVAFGKLQGILTQGAVTFPFQKPLNGLILAGTLGLCAWSLASGPESSAYWILLGVSLLLGILIVIPIGGADMPVVISLLNSLSGVAAAMAGFVLLNKVLIVAGSLVGAAGLILTEIMCRAMNRSLANVFFSGFGGQTSTQAAPTGYSNVKSCTTEEAALIFDGAQSVIIVPGYGLAVARAQHAISELQKILEKKGVSVKYGIHPVAGRMPGHMNVLLAEADVPYDKLYEMDQINSEFEQTDVVLVIGANDVTNPVARTEKSSPIYGMPILNVDKARSVVVIKRSLSPGYAGIKNPLFENEKTVMFFEDARKAVEGLIKEIS